ncbi:uncharacterized protein DS421_16g548710 [Arachis hypogaea]|nr:uncharacterized protein DS421_16g548710 [Arachis hypogaea]
MLERNFPSSLQHRVCNRGFCEVASETPNLHNPPPQRMKQPIVRPPIFSTSIQGSMENQSPPIIRPQFRLPTPTSTQILPNNEINVPTGSKMPKPSQQHGLSAETMGVSTSGTASRLFKFIPTPGFMPPRKN